jgi:VWFA-related protein
MRLGVPIAILFVLLETPSGVSGRDGSTVAAAQSQDAPVFSVRSELVVLDVLVRDRKNEYVRGLTRDAFIVEEDGVRQTIQFFAESDAPATVGLIIDSSGSMASAKEDVITAVGAFGATSNPEDEIFALTFNDRVRPALSPAAPFTGDSKVLRDAVTRVFRPYGRTKLFDAIAEGFEYLARGTHRRKALIVVGDGGDNASRTTIEEIVSRAETSNTVVHTVALVDRDERDANPKLLKRLSEASGGNAFKPGKRSQVESALQAIAYDIRNSYTIGYVPTNAALDGRLRQIRVNAQVKGQRNLRVRSRAGYVAR